MQKETAVHLKIGQLGEKIAADYLVSKEYRILDKNYKTKIGEIDIVAKKGATFVFVEVKALVAGARLRPEENMNPHKQRRVIQSSKIYLINKHIDENIPWQIDLIAIDVNPEYPEFSSVRHYEKVIGDIS